MKVISGTVLALGAFLVGSAAVVGGLMVSADRLADKSKTVDTPGGEKPKIGTAMEHIRPPAPTPVRIPPAPIVNARNEPAAEPVAAPLAPAAEAIGLRPGAAAVPGRTGVAAPAASVQAAATGAPAIIEDPSTTAASAPVAGDRFPKGSRGCTTYRSYDPRTQTYRGFDGTVKPCRPEG